MRTLLVVPLLFSLVGATCAQPPSQERTGPGDPAIVSGGPSVVSGGSTCANLGHGSYGYRINLPASGTYRLDEAQGGEDRVTLTLDAERRRFDWTSTLSVDAVLVSGGPSANAYTYAHEAFAASEASAPLTYGADLPPDLRSVEFCFDYELAVTTTAQPSLTRRVRWGIRTSSALTEMTLATGEERAVSWEVTTSLLGAEDSDARIAGTVSIHNPAPLPATLRAVVAGLGALPIAPDCSVDFPYILPAGGSLTCLSELVLGGATNAEHHVEVQTTDSVLGTRASAQVDFKDARLLWRDYRVRVFSDKAGFLGDSWASTGPFAFKYVLNIGPYAECGPHDFSSVASFTAEDTGGFGLSESTIVADVSGESCPSAQ